jgi:hypothetical protein
MNKRKTKKTAAIPASLFNKLDDHLQKNDNTYYWFVFAITAIVSLLLYDPRVSLTGDDSGYILGANSFIKDFRFPSSQAALYMIALSPVTLLFGISLFPLKMFSLLSMLGFMYFTYAAFRRRVPACILFPALALVSINSYVLYYASQTYSEAFYMFMQSLFVYVFFRFAVKDKPENAAGWGKEIKIFLTVALAALGVALARPVGISVIVAAAGYFLFYREWKNMCIFLLSFAALYFIYSTLQNLVWATDANLAPQMSNFLNKNPYRPEEGTEDLTGVFLRLWQNSEQYLSNGLFRIMGFRYETGENSLFRTVLVYAVALGGLFLSFKRNRHLFYTITLTGVFLIATFIILAVFWNQERLLIPVYPFILMSVFACFYYLLSHHKARRFQFLYPVFIGILFILGLKNTMQAIPEARKLTNQYSGLTPDWVNYLKASEWAGKNLKKDELAACRKPSMSTVYGKGKNFYGIYGVPTGNAAAFMQEWASAPDRYAAVPVSDHSYRQFGNLRNSYRARVELGERAFWILNRSGSLNSMLDRAGIQALALPKMQELSAQVNNNFGIFYADSLLNHLKEGGVTHILTANLRINPAQKTGQTVSTVERYAFYIQEKYPNLYRFVYQEGADEDEPAQIYEINWDAVKR